MYPLSTTWSHFSADSLEFIISGNFGNPVPDAATTDKLRNIADHAFDLLTRIQKTEKLRKLGQLGKSGEAEYDANIRLVGLMVHILRSYQYQDAEMMSSLEKKYLQTSTGITGKQV